jgi:peptide/nickel transport system substrate-binding protein
MSMSSDVVGLIRSAGGTINPGTAPGVAVLVINQSKGGFTTDKRVRQAFNYAIDKSYAQTLLGGFTRASGQPASRSVNGYQADITAYPYDPEKAKKLLAEAGFPNGLKATAEVSTNDPNLYNVVQAVAQDLARVGVNFEMKVISIPDVLARLNMTKPVEGEFMNFNYGSGPSNDMMRPINAYYNCGAQQKWMCFPEAEEAAKAANTEFDPVKRAAHLRKLAQIFHEEAPTIFLHEQFELDAISGKMKGFRNENWRVSWQDVELAP